MAKEKEYKKLFLQESAELLQQMNQSLLLFEKQPDNKEALNAIFRCVHTLKSMAASMGHRTLSDLAHNMEDVLDQLRGGQVEVLEKTADILFQSFDLLERMINDIREGRELKVDISQAVAALHSVMQKKPQIIDDITASGIPLNEFDKRTIARVTQEGLFPYQLTITLEDHCVLKSVRAFMVFRNLHAIGEVIKSFPDSLSIEEERFGNQFGCVFITRESSEKVSQLVNEVLEVKGVQIVLIPADPAWNVLSCGDAADSDSRESPESFHEHIKKLQSVRVDVLVLDKLMNLVEELTICKLRFADLNMRETSMGLKAAVEQMGRLTDDLQNEVMKARLVPVGQIFERFPRFVRDMAKAENKKVRLDMVGADIELDRTVLDEMGEPLIHLIRNAVDHGIESPAERKTKNKSEDGTITLSARREKNSVFIEVSDDGKGISVDLVKKQALAKGLVTHEVLQQMNDHEVLLLTTQPGFSTKEAITRVSGRGVGLDVARTKMEKLGGSLLIQSQRDEGTKFSMRLPLTTAVIKALLVKSQGRTYAMPVANIIELVIVKEENINTIENRETFFHRDRVLPLVRMDWESHAYEARNALNVVVVETGNNPFGIVVDSLVSQQDIVVKQLARELRGVRGIAGATILGDGNVALVLDVAGLV